MKKLFLLRHAKAAPGGGATRDFERELNERGVREALRAGEFIKERSIRPQLVLCSPAERTKMTIELAVQSSGLGVEPQFDGRIYEASLDDLLKVLASVGDEVEQVLLVGHNPGMEELIRFLTGELRPVATAALALVEIENAVWGELKQGVGRLAWIVRAGNESESDAS